jgi:hypothetical protein
MDQASSPVGMKAGLLQPLVDGRSACPFKLEAAASPTPPSATRIHVDALATVFLAHHRSDPALGMARAQPRSGLAMVTPDTSTPGSPAETTLSLVLSLGSFTSSTPHCRSLQI